MKDMKLIDLNLGAARPRDTEGLDELCESLRALGMIEPVVVNPRAEVISGRRRVMAAKKLGWVSLPALVLALDSIDEELAAIDTNLTLLPLGDLEYDRALARRKELYEAKYPLTKTGKGPTRAKNKREGAAPEAKAFAPATASRLGISKRTVEKAVARASKASPSVNKAREAGTLSPSKVDELVKLEPRVQDQLLTLAVSQPLEALRTAVRSIGGGATQPEQPEQPGQPLPQQVSNIRRQVLRLTELLNTPLQEHLIPGATYREMLGEFRALRNLMDSFLEYEATHIEGAQATSTA